MKIKKLLQEYIEKMEYDKICGEIALEVVEERIKEVGEQLEKAKKAEKEELKNRMMVLHQTASQYKEYIETAQKSRKKAQQRLKKVGLA